MRGFIEGFGIGRCCGFCTIVKFFEHQVGVQGFLDFLLKVEGRQLQQLNGLLKLRGHPQLLADFKR